MTRLVPGNIVVSKRIEVEIYADEPIFSEIGIIFRSVDGTTLTGQMLIDALSDALIIDNKIPSTITPEDSYDA